MKIHVVLVEGASVEMDVRSITYLPVCPHCGVTFETQNARQIYPSASHRVRAWEQRNLDAWSNGSVLDKIPVD